MPRGLQLEPLSWSHREPGMGRGAPRVRRDRAVAGHGRVACSGVGRGLRGAGQRQRRCQTWPCPAARSWCCPHARPCTPRVVSSPGAGKRQRYVPAQGKALLISKAGHGALFPEPPVLHHVLGPAHTMPRPCPAVAWPQSRHTELPAHSQLQLLQTTGRCIHGNCVLPAAGTREPQGCTQLV